MSSLELQSEIQAHSAWKQKFEFAIAAIHREPLDAHLAGDHTTCKLGQWLSRHGPKYAAQPLFQQLAATHAEFHRVAARIVGCVNDGRSAEASALLAVEFNDLSEKIVAQLQQMRNLAHDDSGQ